MNNRPIRCFRLLSIFFLCAAGCGLPSCHRSKTPPAQRYAFTGRVVSIDTSAQSAVIDGDLIQGYMEAMAMTYKVKPASVLRQIEPGDSISADLFVIEANPRDDNAQSDYWLQNVKVTSHVSSPPAVAPNSLHMPAPGEEVPDFTFTNQDGKRISLRQFRGSVVLVTFIYTRCPFADFCPRMSSNFAEIYQQISSDAALANTHLLSVSFDPEHDTPKVLRAYGFSVAHTDDSALFRHWDFAVLRAADLPRVADLFALTIKPENGLITHNLSTAVIGPDGRIVRWYHGSDWQVSDLIKDVTSTTGRN